MFILAVFGTFSRGISASEYLSGSVNLLTQIEVIINTYSIGSRSGRIATWSTCAFDHFVLLVNPVQFLVHTFFICSAVVLARAEITSVHIGHEVFPKIKRNHRVKMSICNTTEFCLGNAKAFLIWLIDFQRIVICIWIESYRKSGSPKGFCHRQSRGFSRVGIFTYLLIWLTVWLSWATFLIRDEMIPL